MRPVTGCGDGPFDVLCAGTPAWEAAVPVDLLPGDGRVDLASVRDLLEATPGVLWGVGGTAAVVAARLAAAGRRVVFAGRVGDDEAGRRVRACLEAAGVGLALQVVPGRTTKHSAILVESGGARTGFRVELPLRAVPPLADRDVPAGLLDGARWLVLDRASEAAAGLLERRRGPAALDLHTLPHRPEAAARLLGLLPRLSLLQVRDEAATGLAARLRGEDFPGGGRPAAADDDAVFRAARELAAVTGRVVVTRGARGAVAAWRGGPVEPVAPVAPAPLRDPTGAGDAFLAAVLDALLEGLPLGEACRRGAAAGAAACSLLGAFPWPDARPLAPRFRKP